MKRVKSPLLGLCPIGKFVFSHEDAMRYKRLLVERLDRWGVRYVTLDGVLPDGMVRDQGHVDPAVRYFEDQRIDALFIPHCNFGTEGAAAMIARQCRVPVLLWGPRDDAPLADGTRLRDSLCGMLATSGVLHKLRVPFSYINNCRIDEPEFQAGVDRFLRAVRVVKTLRTMRIGQLGQRIDFFWSTIIAEAELLSRFGIQVLPIDLVDTLRAVRKRAEEQRAAYRCELDEFRRWVSFNHFRSDDDILYNLALRDELLALAERHGLDGFAVQSFNSIPNEMGSFLQFGQCLVADAGYPVGPESDLHAAVSSLLLEAAAGGDDPSFIPDITIRHPENDNAVLLWHADAPLSLRRARATVKVDLPWILKGLPTGLVHFPLKDGPLTLCRFEGHGDDYRLGCGQGQTVPGPYTQEFYTWMQVDDWPTWERQLIQGPYIHHCSCVYDHCADVLQEALRYVPGVKFERFGRSPSETQATP
jgi:L-fucose isomerase-like protein